MTAVKVTILPIPQGITVATDLCSNLIQDRETEISLQDVSCGGKRGGGVAVILYLVEMMSEPMRLEERRTMVPFFDGHVIISLSVFLTLFST